MEINLNKLRLYLFSLYAAQYVGRFLACLVFAAAFITLTGNAWVGGALTLGVCFVLSGWIDYLSIKMFMNKKFNLDGATIQLVKSEEKDGPESK